MSGAILVQGENYERLHQTLGRTDSMENFHGQHNRAVLFMLGFPHIAFNSLGWQ